MTNVVYLDGKYLEYPNLLISSYIYVIIFDRQILQIFGDLWTLEMINKFIKKSKNDQSRQCCVIWRKIYKIPTLLILSYINIIYGILNMYLLEPDSFPCFHVFRLILQRYTLSIVQEYFIPIILYYLLFCQFF